MKVAVVGGGINGLCSAWMIAQKGHQVSLFESEHLMGKTSMSSSKLLHGGLRYLENFEFRLVKYDLFLFHNCLRLYFVLVVKDGFYCLKLCN
mgnify:CR=1 FL=1